MFRRPVKQLQVTQDPAGMSVSEAEDVVQLFTSGLQVDVDVLRIAYTKIGALYNQIQWAHHEAADPNGVRSIA